MGCRRRRVVLTVVVLTQGVAILALHDRSSATRSAAVLSILMMVGPLGL